MLFRSPEFFAVDKAFRALLLCAVKGGVSCHQTSYLRFSRFNLSLFLRLHFFITHLTLPLIYFVRILIYFLKIIVSFIQESKQPQILTYPQWLIKTLLFPYLPESHLSSLYISLSLLSSAGCLLSYTDIRNSSLYVLKGGR